MKDNPKVTVWAKQWGEIIGECEARLRFFQEKLKYAPTEEDGAIHLASEYAKHVPSAVHKAAAEAAARAGTEDEKQPSKENPS